MLSRTKINWCLVVRDLRSDHQEVPTRDKNFIFRSVPVIALDGCRASVTVRPVTSGSDEMESRVENRNIRTKIYETWSRGDRRGTAEAAVFKSICI